MKIPYYPGCTVKTKAKNFESSALAAMAALGVEMVEMPRWTCCGTVYSLTTDDLVHHLAPIRNLLRVQEMGFDKVTTLCAMCYNTLKRANHLLQEDADKREKINDFMDEEEATYEGGVRTLHLLEILRDEIGYRPLREKVRTPLTGLRVTPYYGCMLLRPPEVGLDAMEGPQIMEEVLGALGAEVVDDPMKTECCGSYHTVNAPDVVVERGYEILNSALKRGSDALALSCPLCDYNLDHRQREIAAEHNGFPGIPVFYFTQLLALSLGVDPEACRFDLHYVDPYPLLESRGLLGRRT